jgi:hypothetical protein
LGQILHRQGRPDRLAPPRRLHRHRRGAKARGAEAGADRRQAPAVDSVVRGVLQARRRRGPEALPETSAAAIAAAETTPEEQIETAFVALTTALREGVIIDLPVVLS